MISSCVSLRTLILNILSTVLTLSSQASFTVEFGDLAPARELTLRAFHPSLLGSPGRVSDPGVWSPPVLMAGAPLSPLLPFAAACFCVHFELWFPFSRIKPAFPFLRLLTVSDRQRTPLSFYHSLQFFKKNTFAITWEDLEWRGRLLSGSSRGS